MLDKEFFNELGKETSLKYRQLVFDPKGGGKGAKDVYGKEYEGYNNPEDESSYGVRKKLGNLYGIDKTPQDPKFKNSNAPVLTGQLMHSFGAMASHSNGFGFGTITKKGVVKHLANMGRVVSTNEKPLPDEVAKFIMKEMTKDVKGAFKKIRKAIKRKKININIGK